MKRDLIAIRFLLQQIEECPADTALSLPKLAEAYRAIPGKTDDDSMSLLSSFKLLKSEKFIIADVSTWNTTEGSKSWDTLKGITWRGYNLIDAIDENRPLDTI